MAPTARHRFYTGGRGLPRTSRRGPGGEGERGADVITLRLAGGGEAGEGGPGACAGLRACAREAAARAAQAPGAGGLWAGGAAALRMRKGAYGGREGLGLRPGWPSFPRRARPRVPLPGRCRSGGLGSGSTIPGLPARRAGPSPAGRAGGRAVELRGSHPRCQPAAGDLRVLVCL